MTKAWNGQEAVEIFEKSRSGEFDVILMDIMMPVMNGYEAAKMIRSLDRKDAKVVPIIAMTANAFTEDRLRAKEAGMDEHIAKPVDVKLLVKVISRLVENSFGGIRNEKEKMEQVSFCTFGDGDSYITSVRLWQKECRKRRCRNDHSIFVVHAAV